MMCQPPFRGSPQRVAIVAKRPRVVVAVQGRVMHAADPAAQLPAIVPRVPVEEGVADPGPIQQTGTTSQAERIAKNSQEDLRRIREPSCSSQGTRVWACRWFYPMSADRCLSIGSVGSTLNALARIIHDPGKHHTQRAY